MDLTYVYAVGDAAPPDLTGVTGIGGRPVHTVTGGGALWAATGTVPALDFGEDVLSTRLEDLTWLATTAREHHAVVDALGARTVVAPLALATVYRDDERVRAVLAERSPAFSAVLDRLRGRTEWGVKAYAAAAAERRDGGRAASGADYLRRRRRELDRAAGDDDAAHAAAHALHEAAAGAAVTARRHRLHAPALTGRPEAMVLNGAYLVDDADRDSWRAAVGAAASGAGLIVEVTGPWVPYSFVADER
ncbi:GvpL/GvpF family gas vesicle protein [Pseudonocardia sp. ICBG1293]|uniref:GvpL/GvpF family gas vesicle protein n=1 Tax=Pseudonocardia sp. ICBG1293 TaxID=2844382 RepID=UPI001CCD6D94|nr:GvpL/GvpF family gas vesicle protein [Pseudonocardia sp. ICBG1293]